MGGYWGLYTTTAARSSHWSMPSSKNRAGPRDLRWEQGWRCCSWSQPLLSGMRLQALPAAIVALAGYVAGGVLASQAKTAWLASRTDMEWAIAIVWTVLAIVTSWWLARAIALCARGDRGPVRGWRLLRFAWLFSATIVSLLLVLDSRYRDFPIALFILPVIGSVLLLLATRQRLAVSDRGTDHGGMAGRRGRAHGAARRFSERSCSWSGQCFA